MKRTLTFPNSDVPLPTEAELEILGVVWEQGRSTVGSAHFVLNERRPRGYTTVLKLMQIMLAKGLFTRIDKERMHFYLPTVTEAQVRAAYVTEIAERLFDGSLFGLASFALSLTPEDEEIDDIRAVLDAHDDGATPRKT
ncbi:BlaI/MecI/CopY family transcriptional regulator [uncultured Sphingomonas sp.]|uniref:BlaI/MecI/CopY family transcriptional regulator n=1 Tax=uncultured Sphingomonas sp. TaxID=158754 RepID=UPI0025E0719E|nr:BlaI/MecI/CopY family transcriptional regulator [uncultured Sphingomonas sp.]